MSKCLRTPTRPRGITSQKIVLLSAVGLLTDLRLCRLGISLLIALCIQDRVMRFEVIVCLCY
jgi:hypothetical protein